MGVSRDRVQDRSKCEKMFQRNTALISCGRQIIGVCMCEARGKMCCLWRSIPYSSPVTPVLIQWCGIGRLMHKRRHWQAGWLRMKVQCLQSSPVVEWTRPHTPTSGAISTKMRLQRCLYKNYTMKTIYTIYTFTSYRVEDTKAQWEPQKQPSKNESLMCSSQRVNCLSKMTLGCCR